MTDTIYPLSAIRTLALHAQGLTSRANPSPDSQAIQQIAEKLGCVQIDTLHMVRRSHYLVIWSRLGNYNPSDFDRLLYDPVDRRLFEGWQHAASIIPLKDYRYQMPHQSYLRNMPAEMSSRWLAEEGSRELLKLVLERIQAEGALRTSDFEYNGPRRGSWWDWKPAKNALEHLYAWGDLMISKRVNFQRAYDLTERVLPGWVERSEPTTEQRDRFWIEQGSLALGACLPSHALDYSYRKRTQTSGILKTCMQDGTFVSIQAQLADGKTHILVVHRENLPWLERAASGELSAQRTTFLSPFDSLFWAKGRDELLWNFRQRLEAYYPAPKRQWGYFCLPILHHDRLVGRFDPRLDRPNHRLHLKALYLEPGIEPEEILVRDVATAMRDFLAFHQAEELVIEKSDPPDFGSQLLSSL